MNINISKTDFEILKKFLPTSLFKDLSHVVLNEKKMMISVSKSDADSIIDALTIALTEFGLEESSEPNNLGLQIEGVIDIFSEIAFADED